MVTIRKILVPVDFGELSEAALEKAIAFAEMLGATVTVLHVYEFSLWGIDGGPESAIEPARRIRHAAEKELDRLVNTYGSRGVGIAGLIREGIPWSTILDYARDSAMDLIVVGTHGRRGLPRALLGSVAEKIVRFSTVPVLTIRGPAHPKTAEDAKETGPSNPEISTTLDHGHRDEDT